MKTKKMKENRSGYYIPKEFAIEALEAVRKRKDELPYGFIDGFACALSYLTCQEDAAMHGKTPEEYIHNAIRGYRMLNLNTVLKLNEVETIEQARSKAREVIDNLKASGVNVVDSYIVEVNS